MARRRSSRTGKAGKSGGNGRERQLSGKPPHCSFCGRGRDEYDSLVQGPQATICNLCINASMRLVAEDKKA